MFNIEESQIKKGGLIKSFVEKEMPFTRIYFLVKNGVIIYVGKTINLDRRLKEHSDKSFDCISFIDVPKEDSARLETFYIVKFNPHENKSIPGGGDYIRTAVVCSSVNEYIRDNFASYIPVDLIAYVNKTPICPGANKTMYIEKKYENDITNSLCKLIDNCLKGQTKAAIMRGLIQDQIKKGARR